MKKLLFMMIACLAISLSSCGKADYKAINEKIENNEELSSKEISAVIDYVDDCLENWPMTFEDEEKFLKEYPYALDFLSYLVRVEFEDEMDGKNRLNGENKKRVDKLKEKIKQRTSELNQQYNTNIDTMEIVESPVVEIADDVVMDSISE